MIVGNKVDKVGERTVPPERPIKEYKNKLDIDCKEVSAKTGLKIDEIFQEMLESN
jgi:translation elongation factor EF-4